jgi:hypothetical protein
MLMVFHANRKVKADLFYGKARSRMSRHFHGFRRETSRHCTTYLICENYPLIFIQPILAMVSMDLIQCLKQGFEAVLNTDAKERQARASSDYRKAATIVSCPYSLFAVACAAIPLYECHCFLTPKTQQRQRWRGQGSHCLSHCSPGTSSRRQLPLRRLHR